MTLLFLVSMAILSAFVYMTAVWLLARRIDCYSIVDVAWSFGVPAIAALYALLGSQSRKAWLLTLLFAIWGFRLGSYLWIRIRSHYPKEDGRYLELRSRWKENLELRFFRFFQLQGLSLVFLAMPVLWVSLSADSNLGFWEILGSAVWFAGFIGVSLSDSQLKKFKSVPSNQGQVCQIGLWNYSRHPNYFFESVLWWGYFLFACGSPYGWVSLLCPLSLLYLLLKVTGIPATEEQAVRSKGALYREYQRTTSQFVPWFRKK